MATAIRPLKSNEITADILAADFAIIRWWDPIRREERNTRGDQHSGVRVELRPVIVVGEGEEEVHIRIENVTAIELSDYDASGPFLNTLWASAPGEQGSFELRRFVPER